MTAGQSLPLLLDVQFFRQGGQSHRLDHAGILAVLLPPLTVPCCVSAGVHGSLLLVDSPTYWSTVLAAVGCRHCSLSRSLKLWCVAHAGTPLVRSVSALRSCRHTGTQTVRAGAGTRPLLHGCWWRCVAGRYFFSAGAEVGTPMLDVHHPVGPVSARGGLSGVVTPGDCPVWSYHHASCGRH
jgi:hypothetical protein